MSKRKFYFIHRSAITGRFVSAAFAQKHPRTTVRVRVKAAP